MKRISIAVLALLLWGLPGQALAQTFSSGSNGTDGALNIAGGQGTITFDPRNFNPQLDQDGDGIYHFTTITIGLGTTVKLSASILGEGKPLIWLATGAVQIDGVLDLNGSNGHNGSDAHIPAVAGAGGYSGGVGNDETVALVAREGNGPGGAPLGGAASAGSFAGLGAGHLFAGGSATLGVGGSAYGNAFLLPIIGGSGGSGSIVSSGSNTGRGCGGGAGGGALLIASSVSIDLDGSITANGGLGGFNPQGGGGSTIIGGHGSGGAIRLMAPDLTGSGSVSALGGVQGSSTRTGSNGRVRLEAFRYNNTLTLAPAFTNVVAPGPVFPPATAPAVRVTQIASTPVPANPTGSTTNPDVTITSSVDVTIQLTTQNIPVGSILKVTIQPQTGNAVTVDVTVNTLNGTESLTTRIESGVSRIIVRGNWNP